MVKQSKLASVSRLMPPSLYLSLPLQYTTDNCLSMPNSCPNSATLAANETLRTEVKTSKSIAPSLNKPVIDIALICFICDL